MEPLTDIDYELSRKLYEARGAKVRSCWWNATRAMTHRLAEGCVYVEGWVAEGGFKFEHGWLETPDGRVVDTTLILLTEMGNPPRFDWEYYGAVRYTKDELQNAYGRRIVASSRPLAVYSKTLGRRDEWNTLAREVWGV